jgi:hypothetical protein
MILRARFCTEFSADFELVFCLFFGPFHTYIWPAFLNNPVHPVSTSMPDTLLVLASRFQRPSSLGSHISTGIKKCLW